ncbi:hypothetical protein K2173_025256 [Erythroxylum novogranatense]|uniref:DUF4283 domain-containing protein n=1 Tax=Erythroxylum novogranatense TaxID=1862640 RepID=A0AAV8UDF4_9ROSI|nr:hypothetical protein K2173_025256 [Erythroxylum novogranatense]
MEDGGGGGDDISVDMQSLSVTGEGAEKKEEEQGIELDEEDVEEGVEDFSLSLVGRFLTDKVINFNAMKQTMAALWRPFMGVSIREVDGGLYIFQFFHEVDVNRVLEMSPVTFNNNLLILARMNGFTHPGDVPLFHFDIWVKVRSLCLVYDRRLAEKIGNEISHFIAADPNNRTWSKYMRVRVRLDVRNPLKKEIQLRKKQGEWFRPTLEYEKLPSFCYICGYLDHTERFCRSWLLTPGEVPQRQFEPELRASGHRNNLSIGARWLRDPLNLEGSSPGGIHSSDTASNSDNGRDT